MGHQAYHYSHFSGEDGRAAFPKALSLPCDTDNQCQQAFVTIQTSQVWSAERQAIFPVDLSLTLFFWDVILQSMELGTANERIETSRVQT